MIEAYFVFDEENVKTIEISGHAEYDESGKDIVCAAVSTAIIVTVNAINLTNFNENIEFVIEEGYFKLEVVSNNGVLNKLLLNLDYTIHDLEKQYPNYIKYQKED